MKFSDGGFTASGGEPLLHKKFLITLFELLKFQEIHTAIDTSGFTDIDEDLDRLLKLTDLVMLDIKHLHSDKHKSLCLPPLAKFCHILWMIWSIGSLTKSK